MRWTQNDAQTLQFLRPTIREDQSWRDEIISEILLLVIKLKLFEQFEHKDFMYLMKLCLFHRLRC